MKVGVFAVLYQGLPFEAALDKLASMGAEAVAIGTGNYPGDRHCRPGELLADPGIVRNRLKVRAAIDNARAMLATADEFGSFDGYLWRFAPEPGPRPTTLADVPASTPASDALSRDLRQRGVEVIIADDPDCIALMARFIREKPELWNEDIMEGD